MRDRRSIDLTPPESQILVEFRYMTFEEMAEWMVLIAKCGKCGNASMVDRWQLQRRLGKRAYISSIAPRLKCSSCGNRDGNRFLMDKMPR